MPKNVTQYDLLISCPGDIQDEIAIIESAVDQFNTQFSDALGISVRTKYWKKNPYAQSGGKPQALLNGQFVKDCDAAVAVFWTRFGTPTDRYGSGTEEEINIMLDAGKQVFMYFSDKLLPPSKMDSSEYKRVQAFREKYREKGIYFSYASDDVFKSMFFAHLSQYFLSEKRASEIKEARRAVLKLVGIDARDHVRDTGQIVSFMPNAEKTAAQYMDIIRKLHREISEMQVGKRAGNPEIIPALNASFRKPVEINGDDRKFLSSAARQLELDLPDGFFDLGNLVQDTAPANMLWGVRLDGTEIEKKKYRCIQRLKETISKYLDWAPVEKAFSGNRCLKLALQNCGTAVDEDIEITLRIARTCFLAPSGLPLPGNGTMGYLLHDCDMSEMFGIPATAAYMAYASFQLDRHPSPRIVSNPGQPYYVPNYHDEYIRKLNDVFCYFVYEEGDGYLIKLKFDYIKHHTVVAFPTVLFIQEPTGSIDYTITTKNAPDAVAASIAVKE